MKHFWSLTAIGVVLTGLFAVAPRTTEASLDTSETYLTFGGPVALPGVMLPKGTYVFELPVAGQPIVRVWSRDRMRLFFTAFTYVVDRPPEVKSDERVTFGEATRDGARRITVWYPADKDTGREFVYR